MTTKNIEHARGAEWRQWDLHIHTPASFHWTGQHFDEDPASSRNAALVDEMIEAMNSAEPAVFAIMDYWTFDGWFALKRRLAEADAPKLNKVVFPGIELRLAAPTECRLNAHVLFSDQINDQTLRDFKSMLKVAVIDRPLSNAALMEVARSVTEPKLKYHGFTKTLIDVDDQEALRAGSAMAELDCASYKDAIACVPDGLAVGFMPYDTSDGLAEVKWREHYAYFIGLFKGSPIFESRDLDRRAAFINEVTEANAKWIRDFQTGLGNIPRLVVCGSDAHRFKGTRGDNNKRGYGDFPSGKATWIKADPSFRGLLHAIKEPAKRSWIGGRPPKLVEVAENKTFYIDSIRARRISENATPDTWLDGCALALNPDLVAIIGNKGSGKSALADVIALLGHSRQKAHFSFLRKDRFRGKSGDPARQFEGTLTWCDGTISTQNLNSDPPAEAVEMVRYIPQGHFEELCNEHVSGRSNAFERELRAVIFAHANESIRLGALDFDQLIEQQETRFRDKLGEFRKDLTRLNVEISGIEDQLNPEVKRKLQELLRQKERQIEEHKKIAPAAVPKPSEQLTPDQQNAATALESIAAAIQVLQQRATSHTASNLALAKKSKAIQNLRERMRLLERAHRQFEDDCATDLDLLGLKAADIAALTLNVAPLENLAATLPSETRNLEVAMTQDADERIKLGAEQATHKARLNAPQLQYQAYLKEQDSWSAKLVELMGSPESPDTLHGLEARIAQLDALPQILVDKRERRLHLASEIFDVLDEQRKARELLFKPVQDVIQTNSLIRDDYRLQFQASLGGSAEAIADSLFALVKQNSGDFRGGDESFATVKRIADHHDFTMRSGVLSFAADLTDRIEAAAIAGTDRTVGIANALRKDKAASDVYDLIFGLSFLEPRYSLLFQDAHIEQLSPGQRGALLLIFYLLVDRGRNPIILDQPEENLDNETVVSLLVPVLSEAKKRRQIIMVTHNPNLAVVCDAEQVIHSRFNRKEGCAIDYTAGAIESPRINLDVVNVLEGTKPAFENRRGKYH